MTNGQHGTRVDALFRAAAGFYENGDPGHDLSHVTRVMNLCLMLADGQAVEMELLLSAALLHDVVNIPKDHPDRLRASAMAAQRSVELLSNAGFRACETAKISNIITEHSYSLAMRPGSLESAILQDADKLDALGAIGVMRAVTCGCRLGSYFYDIRDPLARARQLDERRFSIDHFSTKLFKLPDLMNTPRGRDEAIRRVEFMRTFLSELCREIGADTSAMKVHDHGFTAP